MRPRHPKIGKIALILNPILALLLIFIVNSEAREIKRPGWKQEIAKRVKKGGIYAIDEEGRPIFSMNPHQLLVPASTLKVATALCGFHYLGKDPCMTSEEIEQIARILKDNGLKYIRSIRVDASAFEKTIKIPGVGKGAEPYNFPLGALSANFNTIVCEINHKGNIVAPDNNTPVTPFALRLIREKNLKGRGIMRIMVGPDPHYPGLYAGSLFRAFLEKEGIRINGEVEEGIYPEAIQPFYIHQSSMTLEEMVQEMLLHSNNFIANQIFLASGAKAYGYPATLEKGVRAMDAYIRNNCNIKDFRAVEGSGISRENGISAESLVKIMTLFKPYRELLVKKRGIMGKTGTLKGAWAVAGFFSSQKNGLVTFAIILNQPSNFRWEILKYMNKGLQ